MPLERTIVRQIMRMLQTVPNSYALKIHGSAFQRRGVPDIMFLVYWRTPLIFFFEVKRLDEKATEAQWVQLERLQRAGAIAEVVYSKDEVHDLLRHYGIV